MTYLKRLVCISMFCTSLLQSQGQWTWQNPQPQGNRLNAVHVFSNGEILGAGANGTLVRGPGNGGDWQVRHHAFGPASHEIDEMQFVDDNVGWARESEFSGWSDVYCTSDRGDTWETRTRTPFAINDLFALDGQYAWGAGIAHGIARTTNAGQTWTTHNVTPAGNFTGGGVFFLDQNRGWIVGGSGILGGYVYGRIFQTLDGGTTWSGLFTDTVRNTTLGEVCFVDANTGWVGGEDGLIMGTTDGGHSWTKQYHRRNTNYAILDILFHDQNNGIAVGTDGLVVTTTDGGQTWMERDSGTEAWIRDVSPANDTTMWGCGDFGLLIKSDDAGQSWSQVSTGVTSAALTCVTFSDEHTGWAGGGAGGMFLKTEDGGENWFVAGYGEHPVTVLQFLDANNGFRIEWYGQTYRTRDGGNTWELTDTLGRDGLYQNGFFADTSNGWLSWNYLGDGYIRKTSNGGKSWQTVLSVPGVWLWESDFVDANTGWVCGGDNTTIANQQGYIFKTTDGGATWLEQVGDAPEPLYDIDFIDEHTGWCVGAWGTTLATTDGGATWNPVNIPLTQTLADVVLLDANTGWIFGNDGVARTHDAGQTWESFTMPHGQSWLYGAAHFTNPENGWLVGGTGHILKFEAQPTSIDALEPRAQTPSTAELFQNYPNPFNPTTTIRYALPRPGHVRLTIFNILGERVATLVDEAQDAGYKSTTWNASGVASGVYVYLLQSPEEILSRKLMLLK